jgi:alkylhydroperoxidase family enzyme
LKAAQEVPFGETASVSGLSDKEAAILAYTDAMTREVKVSDECFEKVKGLFTEREVVELTACIAGYNCVSRFLVALDVGENNGKGMKGVEELVRELGLGGK